MIYQNFVGWFWRSFAMQQKGRQVVPCRNNILWVWVCQARISRCLHSTITLLAVDTKTNPQTFPTWLTYSYYYYYAWLLNLFLKWILLCYSFLILNLKHKCLLVSSYFFVWRSLCLISAYCYLNPRYLLLLFKFSEIKLHVVMK